MKYSAVIVHSLVVQLEADDYREAVDKSLKITQDLRQAHNIPYRLEQVQKEDD